MYLLAAKSRSPSKHALANRHGAAMVEFALVLPVFLLLLFAVFGVGLTALYQQFLDDSVRDAARQVQMATGAATSSSGFVNAVCARFGILAASCQNSITYSVRSSSVAAGFSALTPETLSASGTYSNAFFPGVPFAANVPFLVQVAYPMPFGLPFVGVMATGTNTASITASAASRVEPF